MSIADGWKCRLRKVAALLFSSPPHATSLIYGSAEIQDITDRKRADQALRGREAMFHPVADNIQEIFWMVDAITKQAIYVNPSFEQVTGGTIAGLMNAPLSYREIIPADDRAQVSEPPGRGAEDGVFDEQFRIVRSEGNVRWVAAQGFPVRDAQGDILRPAHHRRHEPGSPARGPRKAVPPGFVLPPEPISSSIPTAAGTAFQYSITRCALCPQTRCTDEPACENISAETMPAPTASEWPGNIRELENIVERMVILAKGPVLFLPPVELETIQAVLCGKACARAGTQVTSAGDCSHGIGWLRV